MSHFVLTWELGGGLGHAGRLKPVARELVRRGHRVSLVLRDLVQTDVLLRDLDVPRYQAPVWLHNTVGVPKVQASMAEILLALGYLDANALRGLVAGWANLIRLLGADALVCDYSPSALVAARALDVPTTTAGIGFFLPPDQAPMPAFLDWEPIAAGRLEYAESRVSQSVTDVLAEYGARPFDRLAQLFRGDRPVLCTWPEIDHYTRDVTERVHFSGPSLGDRSGEPGRWPECDGPKVFAYLRGQHPDSAAVLTALAGAGARTLCYMPEVAAGKPTPVVSPRIRYARRPVDLFTALDGCALCVGHGGEATIAHALLHGVPLLLLPMQTEQFLISRNVERGGYGLNAALRPRPADWPALVRRLLDEPAFRARAHDFATAHAGYTQERQTAEIADAAESTLR